MHEVRAFLCGYFTRNIQANFEKMESDGWERKKPGAKYIADMKRIYYPEFVDFCFAYTDADKGCVELTEVQFDNSKRMDCGAFLRGHAVAVGTVLGE